MQTNATRLAYNKTNSFSALVLDYLSGQDALKPFYRYPATIEGIKAAMNARQQFNTDRGLLTDVIKEQYAHIPLTAKQENNLRLLADEHTYSICTAHQPNIFTGPLYFIYKIMHAIKVATELSEQIPGANFVPVYYMGSEDADLAELGYFYIEGQKYEWKTDQTGAVGRMKVDKAFIQLIQQFSGQITVLPHGKSVVELMSRCYTLNTTIQQATFTLVNELFAEYGLLQLLPDNSRLKAAFIPVMEKELIEGFSHQAVEATVKMLPVNYKAQASGRDINLFYLKDNRRDRIEHHSGTWSVVNGTEVFSKEEILQELRQFPERFSPNVILRPVLQETVLPGVVFIGGGGELAYWMELQQVFDAVGVPYPVLLLRNSLLLVEKDNGVLLKKLQFSIEESFSTEMELMNKLVKRDSQAKLTLDSEKELLHAYYQQIKDIAVKVDHSLQQHTEALYTQALKKIIELEKKLLRAEKKKFEAEQRQLHKMKNHLFPHNNLQERVENFMTYYAKWGNDFFETVYQNSLSLEQQFVVVEEQ